MGTLNPDLLTLDTRSLLDEAVRLKDVYQKPNLMPELLLLAMLNKSNTAASLLLEYFKTNKKVDLQRLNKIVQLAVERQTEFAGNLFYLTEDKVTVELSRQTIILIDEALTLANRQGLLRVDTDHLLQIMAEPTFPTSRLLGNQGIDINVLREALPLVFPHLKPEDPYLATTSSASPTQRNIGRDVENSTAGSTKSIFDQNHQNIDKQVNIAGDINIGQNGKGVILVRVAKGKRLFTLDEESFSDMFENWLQTLAPDYVVKIDDEIVGYLNPGEFIRLGVEVGNHKVQIEPNMTEPRRNSGWVLLALRFALIQKHSELAFYVNSGEAIQLYYEKFKLEMIL